MYDMLMSAEYFYHINYDENEGCEMEIKNKITDLLKSTERPGIENLINHMEEIGFFTAPCSTQYHLCREGGLAEHSLGVYEFGVDHLQTLIAGHDEGFAYQNSQQWNQWVIVSLLHDIGKASYRGKPNYIPNILKTTKKQSEDKPYLSNPDRPYIAHEIISLQILNQYIELTEEEEFAIFYHNGLYVATGRDLQGKERPLQQILHFADMYSSRFIEKED